MKPGPRAPLATGRKARRQLPILWAHQRGHRCHDPPLCGVFWGEQGWNLPGGSSLEVGEGVNCVLRVTLRPGQARPFQETWVSLVGAGRWVGGARRAQPQVWSQPAVLPDLPCAR